ncbi:glycosyltransferase family 2 protein [Thermonema rossianum]|uniref:glycosyltransferase family 2 protein n=1 Tax=Thermonema rossianum TaxID=55505 RepID=UPI0005716EC5|nr:glycosyltransferase family 2 protein [Thermonema rossianum]
MKIFATVVTYNRLTLLQQCIEHLRSQTRKPDAIIVINNGSTDNTLAWLREQTDLIVVTQENTGSAGGEYTAAKTAYEMGADYVWMMDDDCIPELDALEYLTNFLDRSELHGKAVVGCLVCSNQEENKLSFPLTEYPSSITYFKPSEIKEKEAIRTLFFTFLGILIPKEAIRKIGYPDPRYFIRCDDIEYAVRLKKLNFPIYIVTRSIARHPRPQYVHLKMLGVELLFTNDDSKKIFYGLRNSTHLLKKHTHPIAFIGKHLPKQLLLATYKAIAIDKSLKSFFIYLKAIVHGLTNRLGKVEFK